MSPFLGRVTEEKIKEKNEQRGEERNDKFDSALYGYVQSFNSINEGYLLYSRIMGKVTKKVQGKLSCFSKDTNNLLLSNPLMSFRYSFC